MKILHLSHTGLPDLRIEKTALTMKTEGHELIFMGGRPIRFQNLSAFEKTVYVPLGNDLNLALNPSVRKRWLQKIDEINPDVIHAHNVLIANFLLGTDYAVIYDDHEYWSKQAFKYAERKLPRGLTSRPLMYLIPIWERKILSKYPILTTNENIAREHRRLSRWVGVTRNMPTRAQVENLQSNNVRSGSVYSGGDFSRVKFLPHRNMTGVDKLLEFEIVSGLPYDEMLTQLTNYRIGLTPWIPHPWHPYSDANRNYEYLHAGLHVVTNHIIKEHFNITPYVHSFTNLDDISEIVRRLPDADPEEIMKHAQQQYVWENQENIIREAYKVS